MSAKIGVLIADDQELFRDGVGMLIESQKDLALVGTAANGREAIERSIDLKPDVLLMDIRMPGLDGIAATELLMTDPDHHPKVIVVTTFRRDEAVARAIRAGASGFVTKDADPEFLLAAIRTVHSGQAVIAPAATFDLLARFGGGDARPVDDESIAVLSPREKEIFLLVAKGLSNSEIAADAFVEETTVKTHIGSILAKLGLRSRVQVVAFAWEHGLVR